MVNLTKLEFTALQSSGRNYLSWVLDAEIHLDAMCLGDTIKEENKTSNQNYARAMIFLRHHLDEILKNRISDMNEVYAHHARRGKGRGPNRGRGHGRGQERNSIPDINHSSNKKEKKDEKREATRESCFRCGGKGHYARDCHTPKHLVELYQESLKKKEKNPEANFISENQVDITDLDVADFFAHPEGKIDHLIGDGSVNMEE
ncbi:uncharacterized protein [Solanum lycopersicum]|uniref:uncharacterized protein n=1 Tax=Solanum lycopersicum TaxID=4081 RepID=UPI00374A96A7